MYDKKNSNISLPQLILLSPVITYSAYLQRTINRKKFNKQITFAYYSDVLDFMVIFITTIECLFGIEEVCTH